MSDLIDGLKYPRPSQYFTYTAEQRKAIGLLYYKERQRRQARSRNRYWRSLDYANSKRSTLATDIAVVLSRLR
jgi:hypothetical protein